MPLKFSDVFEDIFSKELAAMLYSCSFTVTAINHPVTAIIHNKDLLKAAPRNYKLKYCPTSGRDYDIIRS